MTIKQRDKVGNQSTFSVEKQNKSSMSFRYTNETYSGCDMVASITMHIPKQIEVPTSGKGKSANGKGSTTTKTVTEVYTRVLGELQTISYSIHMEKRPVRAIGNVNAKDYVIGPRTIAGSLVFSVFNKHFAQDIIEAINNGYSNGTSFLVDELPPFDITISAANEYGYRSRLVVYGVRLLNEGQVMSVNDVYTENTYQFMATDVEYLTDEMKYSSKLETGGFLYKLTDPYIETNKEAPYSYLQNKVGFIETNKQKEDKAKRANQNIRLTVGLKQPTKSYYQGEANFYLSTNVKSSYTGSFHVTSSSGKKMTLAIENKTAIMKILFDPDLYQVYYEDESGKLSNTAKFEILPYTSKDLLQNYAPVINKVTDTEVVVYSNEPSHTHVAISKVGDSNYTLHEISKRTATIKELTPDTSYQVFTINPDENISSRIVTFITLESNAKMIIQLEKFIHANAPLLVNKDLKIYMELLNELKDKYDVSDMCNSIYKLKKEYIELYNSLGDVSNSLKDEYDYKIKALGEMLLLAAKVSNDYIKAINVKIEVPMPTTFMDANYNNIFTFDESISSAEFFRVYNKLAQFANSIKSSNFTTIEDNENSFRYIGKPGVNHYVQAIYNHARSPKLYFYSLSDAEKQQELSKIQEKTLLSSSDIEKIQTVVSKEYRGDNLENNYERAILFHAKQTENQIVLSPQITEINENTVKVKTPISNLIADDFEEKFYLSIASYNDVINDNYIYKVPFTNKESEIEISRLFDGIEDSQDYAIWIENASYSQICNATTFNFSEDFDIENDEVKDYEMQSIISTLKTYSDTCFPADLSEIMFSEISNNQSITSCNLIEHVLEVLSGFSLIKSQLLKFLSLLYKYIGIIDGYNSRLISEIEYNNMSCSFDSNKEGSVIIYEVDPNKGVTVHKKTLLNHNEVIYSDYAGNLLIILAIDKTLNSKSDMIVVNKAEKYVEVI